MKSLQYVSVIVGILLLGFPALHAQYTPDDFLNWTRQHLDNGDCEKARATYELYKDKVPAGNAEVKRRIDECQTSGNLTFKVGNVTFKMIFVQGGTFQLGNSESDYQRAHTVTVSDFYMGEFEVTQALWQEVMGTTIYQQRDKEKTSRSVYGVGADYPMYYVSHTEAEEFCGRMNQRLRSQLPVGYRFALPTEAEWEYAARGGSKSKGYTYSGGDNISDVGWCEGSRNGSAHSVGLKKANELGLYDMSGNVWEWCEDWYGPYSSSSQTDPRGPSSGLYRVLRGGCWIFDSYYSRVDTRSNATIIDSDVFNGFRLAIVRR